MKYINKFIYEMLYFDWWQNNRPGVEHYPTKVFFLETSKQEPELIKYINNQLFHGII